MSNEGPTPIEELATRHESVRNLWEQFRVNDVAGKLLAAQVAERDATIRDLEAQAESVLGLRSEIGELRRDLLTLMTEREERMHSPLQKMGERLLRHEEETQSILYDLQAAAPERTRGSAAHEPPDEGAFQVRRVRELVRRSLPFDVTVLVANEERDEFLKLSGRQTMPFPQDGEGSYAGRLLADDEAAVVHLEALRGRGAEYFLIPASSLALLERYPGLRAYLQANCRVLVREDEAGWVFSLRERPAGGADRPRQLATILAEAQRLLSRGPSVLDWDSGLRVAESFPGHTVFSPQEEGGQTLPYLEKSVDLVVLAEVNPDRVAEATRVASAGVVLVPASADGKARAGELRVEWTTGATKTGREGAAIIIPSCQPFAVTEPWLAILLETLPPDFGAEILVVDDAPSPVSEVVWRRWEGRDRRLRVLRSTTPGGYWAACNWAARVATEEIVIFLHPRTLPRPGWLAPVLDLFTARPDAGVVAAKLLGPDGRLVQAGASVLRDGAIRGGGAGDAEPTSPRYNFVRRVEFCSAAFLATRRPLFVSGGGFDNRWRAAPYPEADYCFRLREKGHVTYYQPECSAICLQGVPIPGTDAEGSEELLRLRNDFVRRWEPLIAGSPTTSRNGVLGGQAGFAAVCDQGRARR